MSVSGNNNRRAENQLAWRSWRHEKAIAEISKKMAYQRRGSGVSGNEAYGNHQHQHGVKRHRQRCCKSTRRGESNA